MGQTEKMVFEHFSASDVGCVRDLNEDSLFCGDNFWLVADGMGGHACGEVASQLAVETLVDEFDKTGDISESIQTAHRAILLEAQNNPNQAGMGTTVVCLSSFDDEYEIAWVGDSRAYLWDSETKQLSQLSEDHSLVVRLQKSGLITAEDARKHPQKHMITQCLGSKEMKQLDVDTYHNQWQPKQQVLLCSDGLTDEVEDSVIEGILAQEKSNQEKVEALIDSAKQAGGRDNISIILIDSPVTKKSRLLSSFDKFILSIKKLFNQ
jgi:protein phosphatase